MKPYKPRSSEKLGKLELHCCFCLCKPGCIWSPITCETSRISWKVVVIGSRTESNENCRSHRSDAVLGDYCKKPGKKVTKRTKQWHQWFIFLHFSSWMSANGMWIQEAPPAKLMGGARIHHIFHRIFAQARSLCSIVFGIENTPRLCQMLILLIPFHQVHH